jgi:alkylation response protein AidB-like acyl-CoA dehydrogenase
LAFPLAARTEAGARLVALAERLAAQFEPNAAEHDREGVYPRESFAALKAANYFAAPIPTEHGGLGVTSVHDLVVASSRLAHGEAAVAIGVNMHLQVAMNLVRRWQLAVASGNQRRADAFAASMEEVAIGGIVMAAAISEPGQDLTRPKTTAVRTADGWRVDGQKIFCTMSPAASVLVTSVAFTDSDGVDKYGFAQIPRETPGVAVNDDWDALGMRASGSNSVTFTDVELPAEALRGGFPIGTVVPYMERNVTAGLFHASASLGIAEQAHETATQAAAKRARDLDEPHVRTLAAASAIDLSACRAFLSRAAGLVDEHYAANPTSDGSDEEVTALFAETQAAKTFVNERAVQIVDRALALSGGAGYLSKNPLSRAYRDVRAGAFMHPLNAIRAQSLLGQVTLGIEPSRL